MQSSQIILGVLSLLLGGGFVGTLAQALRARPEREAVIILPWKELNSALSGQNETLRAELTDARSALVTERTAHREADSDRDRSDDERDRWEAYARELRRLLISAGVDPPPMPR